MRLFITLCMALGCISCGDIGSSKVEQDNTQQQGIGDLPTNCEHKCILTSGAVEVTTVCDGFEVSTELLQVVPGDCVAPEQTEG